MEQLPKMILFDYGQTLVAEEKFQPLKGTIQLLKHAVCLPEGVTAESIQELANDLSQEIRLAQRAGSRNESLLEISDWEFNRYLYEFSGIKFDMAEPEVERIFWDAAAPGKPTEEIEEFLEYLYQRGIRTGVISNMMYCGKALEGRLARMLPGHHFEMILASSDYIFRKPHPRIFGMAVKKAELLPEEIWYCGDNPVCDVEGAYRAGMKPVWYPTYADYEVEEPAVPHRTVNNWKELKGILEVM